MGLRDYFDQQVNDELAKEATTKPFIPQGSYRFRIVSWREDVYPDSFRDMAGVENVQLTFALYTKPEKFEDGTEKGGGEFVGRHTQDFTWVDIRDNYGKLRNQTKVFYQIMKLTDANTMADYVRFLDSEPVGECFGLESIACKVKDLGLDEQDKAISSGKGMDDTVYVNNPSDEQREQLMDKGYTSRFMIVSVTPLPDLF